MKLAIGVFHAISRLFNKTLDGLDMSQSRCYSNSSFKNFMSFLSGVLFLIVRCKII